MTNVIKMQTGQPKPAPMEISEHSLQVGDELYRVRRAVEPDTNGGGFVMIYDSRRPACAGVLRAVPGRARRAADRRVADRLPPGTRARS